MGEYVVRSWRPGHRSARGRLVYLGEQCFRAFNSEITERNAEPAEGGDLVCGGYFSTADPDIDNFVIHADGWNAGLDTFMRRNPRFLWMHDPYQPIGNVIAASTDERGLAGRVDFDKEDELARKLHSKVRRGYLGTFSVGFRALDEPELVEEQLHFRRMQLMEVSLVTIPANINAGVNERSMDAEELVQRAAGLMAEKWRGASERIAGEIVARAGKDIDAHFDRRRDEHDLEAAQALEARVGTLADLLKLSLERKDAQERAAVLAALRDFKVAP